MRLKALVTAIVVTCATVVVGIAAPAAAATGCGTICNGKNPATYNVYYCGPKCEFNIKCQDDAVIHASRNWKSGWIQLMYSPYCRTAWVKSYHPNAEDYSSYVTSSAGYQYWRPAGSGVGYSPMVNDAGYCAIAWIRFQDLGGPVEIEGTDCY